MELKLVHEDNRRALYEFGEGGNWKVAKYLEIKQNSIIGDHYHKNKDELFLLVSGGGYFNLSESESYQVAPFSVLVKRGTYHKFELTAGSILICLASELHDPNDDHKL